MAAQPYKGDRLRYYATFSKPRKWFGVGRPGNDADLNSVIAAYKAWLAERGEQFRVLPKGWGGGKEAESRRTLLPPGLDADEMFADELDEPVPDDNWGDATDPKR